MARQRLPIGVQTFRKLRDQNCYYVDKTQYIARLLQESGHYFPSRPRRFGKSLFLDTLKELFEGNEALFDGLHIHGRWDWTARNPVMRLSFAGGTFRQPGNLHANLMAQLDGAAERFGHLIRALSARVGAPVVVLVDEYDKPILDALEDFSVARANRDDLRGLYGVIKDADAHTRFAFLTGSRPGT